MTVLENSIGLAIKESDSVYAPAEDTYLALEVLQTAISSVRYADVLDMGTGTGILGLHASLSSNVRKVLFADINPAAVELASENAKANSAMLKADMSFIVSDLFKSVNGKFDIIIFNAPYLPHSASDGDMLSRAWDGGDKGIELTLRFLKEAKYCLKDRGKIIMVESSHGDLARLHAAIEHEGYHVSNETARRYFFEEIIAIEITIA